MRRRTRCSVAVMAALAGGACQGVTEPAELPVVLSTGPVVGGASSATIQVEGQRVVVRGIVGTPDPCYRFSARAVPKGATLDLRLEARPLEVTCIQIVGSFRYELTVHDVPSGRWLVRLHATRHGSPTEARLAEGTVIVP